MHQLTSDVLVPGAGRMQRGPSPRGRSGGVQREIIKTGRIKDDAADDITAG